MGNFNFFVPLYKNNFKKKLPAIAKQPNIFMHDNKFEIMWTSNEIINNYCTFDFINKN